MNIETLSASVSSAFGRLIFFQFCVFLGGLACAGLLPEQCYAEGQDSWQATQLENY